MRARDRLHQGCLADAVGAHEGRRVTWPPPFAALTDTPFRIWLPPLVKREVAGFQNLRAPRYTSITAVVP